MNDNDVVPPSDTRSLATWFAEAVRAELAELEKKGGDLRYELHGGHLLASQGSRSPIFRFELADSTLVPEGASGTLEVEGNQYKASVVAQVSSRIDVEVENADSLGSVVARAILRVDDLGLLRKLAEVLDGIASGGEDASPLAARIFHPASTTVGKVLLPPSSSGQSDSEEQRNVLEQACGSEITFVWGPPGTGKTHVIARLIEALVARGERVLMTSHTHAAVDECIFKAVNPENGPLAGSELVREGMIVRIGRVTNPKIPEPVILDKIVEQRAMDLQGEVSELHRKAAPLVARRTEILVHVNEWNRLAELRGRSSEAERNAADLATLAERRSAERSRAGERVRECSESVEQAEQAWFFRATRIRQAQDTLAAAERRFGAASTAASETAAAALRSEESVESIRLEVAKQEIVCGCLTALAELNRYLDPIESELDRIELRLAELRMRLDALEREVVSSARVIAATLTKCYVGDQLEGQNFDAVIVDEISMALPPLLFVAARHALKRVILVGDFKQLPPIVRSDNDVATARLRRDAFHLSGVARNLDPTDHATLVSLRTQRRMARSIADAARAISYGPTRLVDHASVLRRAQPEWLEFLSENALCVVDTADLHTWSGRQAGSLSRFNLYSAQICVELAAIAAAAGAERADNGAARPIGIVTPYAAQRRLLGRLIHALGLSPWVDFGTVHTFQGGEADLIIFDSVLDEPFWTARLCNPKQREHVRRDLNVALTRAKFKFVMVGSSEWLNSHAKPHSALGELWEHLKAHADLVAASELVEVGFADRIAGTSATYSVPEAAGTPALMPLDEHSFFESFSIDLRNATESIFGLVPYFGEYRWPKVEPLIRAALERGVEVTLVTPPVQEADNETYVKKAIRSLRELGAVVVSAMGLHGKDVVIDSRIVYVGSCNWASHRGRLEMMHRVDSPEYARTVLEFLQARHVRAAGGDGASPRVCPECQGPTQVVNQVRNLPPWDKQPLKVGCANYKRPGWKCKGYLVNVDQRSPFTETPVCEVDRRTKYRRIKRGRGEAWECPKHPKTCERFKVVAGDP